MKQNNIPFDEAQWEQIVDDAFSSDAKPHVFSDRYQKNKLKMEETFMPKRRFHIRKSVIAVAAVAAAAVLVPSTAFAVNSIHAYLTQKGSYQQDLTITADNTSTQPMALSVGWMPDGMGIDPLSGKYADAQGRGITMEYYKADSNENFIQDSMTGIIDQSEYTCGENTMFCLQRDVTGWTGDGIYDRIVWVTFPDSRYAVEMYVTDDVLEDELKQIAENLSLTPSDEETASVWINSEEEPVVEPGYEPPVFDLSKLQTYAVGETVTRSAELGDEVSVRVNSVSMQDNFDGITTDSIGMGADYSEYLSADGTIQNTRTWYSRGNGIDTLDEYLREETIPQRVVVLRLTYTNNTAGTLSDICICPTLFRLDENNKLHSISTPETEDSYCTDSCRELKSDDMAFSFASDHEFSKNNLTQLAAGESAEVTLAFLVDADQTDGMYLNILPAGHELAEDLNAGCPAIQLG